MAIEIRRVTDPEELQAIYRFRYDIYVTEMNRVQRYADHENKTIIDPLDATAACILGAFDNGKVVGTVRTNFVRDGVGEYFELYRLNSLNVTDEIDTYTITTRLMIGRSFRNTLLGYRLSTAVYKFGLSADISFDVIDCNFERLSFFTRLGYRTFLTDQTVDHPEYGTVWVLRLPLRDFDWLKSNKSPFAAILKTQSGERKSNLQKDGLAATR